jgi:hypothetical protein
MKKINKGIYENKKVRLSNPYSANGFGSKKWQVTFLDNEMVEFFETKKQALNFIHEKAN